MDRHPQDHEPLAQALPDLSAVLESLGETEQRLSYRVGDSWCRSRTLDLRSGVRLGVTECQFEPTFSFPAVLPPSELEFIVSKGSALQARSEHGPDFLPGGNTLQLGKTRRPLPVQVRATGDVPMECVSLSLSEARLRELLGVSDLPDAFRSVTESHEAHPLVSRAMTPRLYRLLDEIVNSDARGPSRLLWHEAKSLELLAMMCDELLEAARAEQPRLSADDVERLERVRRHLVERLEEPPTLAALARMAGWNETKLKGGFRALFGTSVFAYVRQARMEEARRLLLARRLNVTEVAQRVGYENPSKFAAAFRKQFGLPPSAL